MTGLSLWASIVFAMASAISLSSFSAFAENSETTSGTEHSIATSQQLKVTEDPDLEKRLVSSSQYKTKSGDTLKTTARFLYGHETWWTKIRDDNETFSNFTEDQVLPTGSSIQYRIPKLGDRYVVQPNDWLIRIVQWKYGATDSWEDIYRRNAQRISNPNLIHPGDVLALELDGTVRNNGTGKVIVEGTQQASIGAGQTESPQQTGNTQQGQNGQINSESRSLASVQSTQTQTASDWTPGMWTYPWNFIFGFLIGLLILSLFSGAWWLRQNFATAEGHDGSGRTKRSHRKVAKFWAFLKPKPKKPARVKKVYENPNVFRSRAVEQPEILKDLIHHDVGELERSPGYELIAPGVRKVKKY